MWCNYTHVMYMTTYTYVNKYICEHTQIEQKHTYTTLHTYVYEL